jgi:sugar/nucleoside kinase (ribokinase family)
MGEDEGELLLGSGDRLPIAATLLEKGAKAIGINRGGEGAYVADATLVLMFRSTR